MKQSRRYPPRSAHGAEPSSLPPPRNAHIDLGRVDDRHAVLEARAGRNERHIKGAARLGESREPVAGADQLLGNCLRCPAAEPGGIQPQLLAADRSLADEPARPGIYAPDPPDDDCFAPVSFRLSEQLAHGQSDLARGLRLAGRDDESEGEGDKGCAHEAG